MDTLTEEERQFLRNIEVMGLPVSRAAEIAGVASPQLTLQKPDAIDLRAKLRDATRQRVNITKDDCINGIREAIDHAKLTDEPMAQIAGWREISKMLGYDAPKQVNITISGNIRDLRKQVAALTDEDLVEALGADDVIDADFYPVKRLGNDGSV